MSELLPKVSIRDLGLAAALVSCHFEVIDTERDTICRAYFMFNNSTELQQAVSAYRADTLQVNARSYSDATKMLKSIIYGER
jgi:hypothetical protein